MGFPIDSKVLGLRDIIKEGIEYLFISVHMNGQKKI